MLGKKILLNILLPLVLLGLGWFLTKPRPVVWKVLNRFVFSEAEMLNMEKILEKIEIEGLGKNERDGHAELKVFWDEYLADKKNDTYQFVNYPATALLSDSNSFQFISHGDEAISFLINKIGSSKKDNSFILQTLFVLGFPVLERYEDILSGNKQKVLGFWESKRAETKRFRVIWRYYQLDTDRQATIFSSFWFKHDVHKIYEIFRANQNLKEGSPFFRTIKNDIKKNSRRTDLQQTSQPLETTPAKAN